MTWNRKTQCFENFGGNRTVALRSEQEPEGEDDGKQLCCMWRSASPAACRLATHPLPLLDVAFDILYCNDKPLLDLPFSERRSTIVVLLWNAFGLLQPLSACACGFGVS